MCIFVFGDGVKSMIVFDWKVIVYVVRYFDLCFMLGYNIVVFCVLLCLKGVFNVINMDGIEWLWVKWGVMVKIWFWFNDWVGCWLGNYFVVDYLEIKVYLSSCVKVDKILVIVYGVDCVIYVMDVLVRMLGFELG